MKLEGVYFDTTVNSIEAHLRKVSSLVSEYKASRGSINNTAITGYMIRKLPASFSSIVSVANTDRDNIDRVEALLIGEEILQLEQQASASNTPRAFVASNSHHNANKNRSKKDITCYHCGKAGHIKPECNKLKKEQENSRKNQRSGKNTDSENEGLTLKVSKMAKRVLPSVSTNQEWFFDSGASDHISGNMSVFSHVTDIKPFLMSLADDSKASVTHKGSVEIPLANGKILELGEVLYCADFGKNSLISIKKLSAKGSGYTIFYEHDCVHIEDEEIVFTGSFRPCSSLYHLDQSSGNNKALKTSHPKNTTSMELMYRRFNYINYGYLIKCKTCTMGFAYIDKSTPLKHCDKCAVGKAT